MRTPMAPPAFAPGPLAAEIRGVYHNLLAAAARSIRARTNRPTSAMTLGKDLTDGQAARSERCERRGIQWWLLFPVYSRSDSTVAAISALHRRKPVSQPWVYWRSLP